jgi:hypothetical protein
MHDENDTEEDFSVWDGRCLFVIREDGEIVWVRKEITP